MDVERSASEAERDQWSGSPAPLELGDRSEVTARTNALYAAGLRKESEKGFAEALPIYQEVLKSDPSFTSLQWRVASQYLQDSRPDLALAQILSGLQASPKNLHLQALAANCYLQLRQYKEAIRVADNVLTQDSEEVYAYRAYYHACIALGKSSEAKALMDRALKVDSSNPEFWSMLARLFTELLASNAQASKESVAKAVIPFYEKAFAVSIPTADLYKQYGDFLVNVNESVRGLEQYKKGLDLEPDNLELLIRSAHLESANGNMEKALEYYEAAYELRPDFPMLREIIAPITRYSGQNDKAIRFYEQLAAKNPTRVSYQTVLGELYEQTSQLEKAEQAYRTTLLLKTPDEDDYQRLAWIQIRMKKSNDASETIAQGRRQFPESARLAFLTGISHRERKDFERALASFAEAKGLAKGKEVSMFQGAYYLEVALTEEMAGKLDQSQKTLEEGLKLEPNNPALQNALAYHWADRGMHLEEALVLSKKSLEKIPGNAAFIDTLGWIYFKLGRYGEALPLLEQALAQTKEDPEVLSHLAEIYEKLGRAQDAVNLWQKVVTKNPEDVDAVQRLKSAQEALKELNAKRLP